MRLNQASANIQERNEFSPTPFPLALAAWLAPQWIALLIAAERVPLWARFSQPGEQWGLVMVVVTQLAMASMLLPWLAEREVSAGFILAGWPMALLAGLLASAPLAAVASAEAVTTIYLWILWLSLRLERKSPLVWAAALIWTIGGPLLLYFHLEFGGGNALSPLWTGPIPLSARLSLGAPAPGDLWFATLPAAALLLSLATAFPRLLHKHPAG